MGFKVLQAPSVQFAPFAVGVYRPLPHPQHWGSVRRGSQEEVGYLIFNLQRNLVEQMLPQLVRVERSSIAFKGRISHIYWSKAVLAMLQRI